MSMVQQTFEFETGGLLKVFIPIGCILFAGLVLLGFYLAAKGIIVTNQHEILLGIVTSAIFGYLLWVGLILLQYRSLRVRLSEEKILIENAGVQKEFKWSDGLRIKDSEAMQTFQLLGPLGERIFMVDYFMPNFELMRSIMKGKLGSPERCIADILCPGTQDDGK